MVCTRHSSKFPAVVLFRGERTEASKRAGGVRRSSSVIVTGVPLVLMEACAIVSAGKSAGNSDSSRRSSEG